jgi:hypothetical protein
MKTGEIARKTSKQDEVNLQPSAISEIKSIVKVQRLMGEYSQQ